MHKNFISRQLKKLKVKLKCMHIVTLWKHNVGFYLIKVNKAILRLLVL